MPIFQLSVVAMAMSLEQLPNEWKIYQALTYLYNPRKISEDLSSSSWELVASRSTNKKY